jgi:hypothetical protein
MKKIKVLILIAVVAVMLGGCSPKKMIIGSTALIMDDVVDAYFTESDVDFAKDAIPGNLKLLDGLIRGSNNEDNGLLLKGCKLYGMYGLAFFEDVTTDKKQDKINLKKSANFYAKSKDYGMRILTKNGGFKSAVDGNVDDFTKNLGAFGKDDVETLFWTAFAWGSYINLNRNSATDVADLPKVKAMIDRVIDLDPSYFYGLPNLFVIVYYSVPAMFGGDPDRAKAAYNAVKSISGDKFVLADYFMAKYYCVQANDRKMFDKLLDSVLNADDNVIPEKLFTQVAKRKAAVLKSKAEDLF